MLRDLLALDEVPGPVICTLIERASDMAKRWEERRLPQALAGTRTALVVDDCGWRNTTAFEVGIQAMGGHCARPPIGFGGKEEVADLGRYLDNWFDLVVVRTPELSNLRALADAASAPVINARTRTNHPCETLGDLAYVQQRRGTIDGLSVAVVSPDANILGSWVEAAVSLPMKVIQIYPEQWWAGRYRGVANFSCTTDFSELQGADVVVTDCWPTEPDALTLSEYRVTAAVLDSLDPAALFIPCPPVTRGQEVSADAMTSSRCCVTEAKAYLLHAQNALLEQIARNAGH